MLPLSHPPVSSGNGLLSALPAPELARLVSHLRSFHFLQGKVLYEAGDTISHVYFLTSGMASLVSGTEGGDTLEVAMVGREGLVGLPAVLRINETPSRIVVQVSAGVMRMRAETLREEVSRSARFLDILLRYTNTRLTEASQSAVCSRYHKVEERLCRWLLAAADRLQSDELHLGQERISHLLGVPRTSVTASAGRLKELGLIDYSRGRILILDRQGLEACACECYQPTADKLLRAAA